MGHPCEFSDHRGPESLIPGYVAMKAEILVWLGLFLVHTTQQIQAQACNLRLTVCVQMNHILAHISRVVAAP